MPDISVGTKQGGLLDTGSPQAPLTFIDLFSGGGGFSTGFAHGFGGKPLFSPVLAVDLDPWAVQTYKLNFPEVPVIRTDLSALGGGEVYSLTRRLGVRTGGLDALLAAPPCQSYSVNNRGSSNRGRADFDVRDYLFRYAVAWLRILRPKVFILENVLPMKTILNGAIHEELMNRLDDSHYVAKCFNLNAVNFGVPQRRERLFYVALRDDVARSVTAPVPELTAVSVRQGISDLPVRRPGQGSRPFASGFATPHQDYGRSYSALMRPERGELIHHHYAKPMSRLALKRLRSLRAGEALAQLPMELQPRMGFRGAYGRLDPDLPAPTITGNFDYVSRGRFSHYDQDRGITFREAARLQSFPDRFRWLGPSYEQIAMQIGNAVPPLLAKSLAQHVGQLLRATLDQPMAPASTDLGDVKAAAD